MEIQDDLYRTVKPNELLTEFKYNSSSETVTLDQLFQNVPPKLLGSFKLCDNRKEVDLLDGEDVMDSIPDGFGPEICRVRRLADGGISCFNYAAHQSDVQPLPPSVGDDRIETGNWYFIEAAEIPNNATLVNYLTNDPNRRNYRYNGRKCAMFLCFKLAAGIRLPPGYECFFDNDPPGHWTIRKSDFDSFDAHYCEIGGGYEYALIPDLVGLGWIFVGLKLKAGGEPAAYNASFDKDSWTLAAIIYEYFSCLSTEVLVNDATNVLSELATGGYLPESCRSPKAAKMLIRVLNDLAMYCNEQELDTIDRFKLGLNEAIMNIFDPVLQITKSANEKSIVYSGIFWCSMFHKLQFIATDFDESSQQPLTMEAERFRAIYRKLHPDCQECPSNSILNALTYRYTLYYLQDVALDTLDFMSKTEASASLKAPVVTTSAKSAGQVSGSVKGDYAAVNTKFIRRASKLRAEWECAVCREGCKIGETWYELCNCEHVFHVQCIGPWIFKDGIANSCPLCRKSVVAGVIK